MHRHYGQFVRKVCLRPGTTCPNRDGKLGRGGCLFCAEPELLLPEPVSSQLDRAFRRLKPGTPVIAYLQDHSATYMPAARLDELFNMLRRHPRIVGVALGTRPDCLPDPILEVLEEHAGAPWDLLVELGLQSAHDQTLQLLNRRHTVADFDGAVAALHQAGVRVCVHVVLGLPTPGSAPGVLVNEGRGHARRTAHHLGIQGVEAVKVHNCHVLRGSPLEALHAQGRYSPPDLERYMDLLCTFLEHLPAEVEIHRLMGEALRACLVSPAFTAQKSGTLQRIRAYLDCKGLVQGCRWQAPNR